MSAKNYILGSMVGAVLGGAAVYVYEKKIVHEKVKHDAHAEALAFYMNALQEETCVITETEQLPCEIKQEAVEDIPAPTYEEVVKQYNTESDVVTEGIKAAKNRPYPIPGNQAGMSGYDQTVLTYFADGVLVDENYKVVPEIDISDFVGGRNFVKMFGDYGEMGVVYIRNDDLETDFEIDQDPRNWRDFKKTVPSFPSGRSPYDDGE